MLDLYAGTGALGFEALSRGAESLTLVERSGSVCRLAQKNADVVRAAMSRNGAGANAAAPITVHESAVRTWLTRASGEFDLVFLDPPYDLSNADLLADLELLVPYLSEGALAVVERSVHSGAVELPAGLELWRGRDYGDTVLYFLEPTERQLANDTA